MLHYAKFATRIHAIIIGIAVTIVLMLVMWNDLNQSGHQASTRSISGVVKDLL